MSTDMILNIARHCLRPLPAIGAMALFFLAAPANRASAEESEPLSVWTYSLYKTITYEFFANLADIPLYQMVVGATPAGAGLFTLVNVTTAAAAYYAHEVLWNFYGPPMQESPETAIEVGIEKVIVYRVVSTARNLALVYAFTGAVSATVTFALISNVADATIYAANEYGWYAWGPPLEGAPTKAAAWSSEAPLPRRGEPGLDPQPVSAAVTDTAGAVRRGALDLNRTARTAVDGIAAGIAGAWSSLR